MIKPRLNVSFSASMRDSFIKANNEYSPRNNEFLFNHNRSAILFILNLLNIKGGNVAVMAYNCHTVMNAIYQAGCHSIFIDVDNSLKMDTDDLQRKAQEQRIDAVIVTHLFGIPNEIDAIRNIINVPIIEDCAHAYLSPGCGNNGDFAIYSLGQGKFPSIGDGGICVINNEKYLEHFKNSYSQVPQYSKGEKFSLFCRMTVKHLCYRPWIYFIMRNFKENKTEKVIKDIKIRRMEKGISTLFNLCQPEIEKNKAHQQYNTDVLINALPDLNVRPLISPNVTNCFMLPVVCKNVRDIQDLFFNKGIETATHFSKCTEWAKSYGYKERECPNTEFFTKHLLVIPTY